MAASVAERRVLALRADLKWAPRSGQLVAAVSAHAEHAIVIGKPNRGAEPAVAQFALFRLPTGPDSATCPRRVQLRRSKPSACAGSCCSWPATANSPTCG